MFLKRLEETKHEPCVRKQQRRLTHLVQAVSLRDRISLRCTTVQFRTEKCSRACLVARDGSDAHRVSSQLLPLLTALREKLPTRARQAQGTKLSDSNRKKREICQGFAKENSRDRGREPFGGRFPACRSRTRCSHRYQCCRQEQSDTLKTPQ